MNEGTNERQTNKGMNEWMSEQMKIFTKKQINEQMVIGTQTSKLKNKLIDYEESHFSQGCQAREKSPWTRRPARFFFQFLCAHVSTNLTNPQKN